MKKLVRMFLLGGLLAASQAVHAQDGQIGYSERVPDDSSDKAALYKRATEWVENHFTYAPKSITRADAAKGEVRVEGTASVKTATPSGQMKERPVRFEFIFHALPTGYDYSVGGFQLVPDASKPAETVNFDEFVAQLATERTNDRTHNDRRVTAQATSLASEIAMAFRSFMNSRPAEGGVE
ncbi:DUF4468 domain-containing protein [Hymenobacter yonginensis]|uniref:DUF4468 domain-containing protein n=1 Tax=Hymenobacter yonginensis TaxID=748197 RepID=A0ABY7PKH5_9BACT|nr:DUF4468 domain-containing protein [Hymenobacter yonginensis]WBO83733.1 DUF4468 domain-containing protein [Hymenobacter yonginensis]